MFPDLVNDKLTYRYYKKMYKIENIKPLQKQLRAVKNYGDIIAMTFWPTLDLSSLGVLAVQASFWIAHAMAVIGIDRLPQTTPILLPQEGS